MPLPQEPLEGRAGLPRPATNHLIIGGESPPTPPSAGARPGASQGPQRRFRREGAHARQERVSAEIASGLGVQGDEDLNDPLPF
jgi:hypothetical protein